MRSLFVLFALASCGRKTPPPLPGPEPTAAPRPIPVNPAAIGIQSPLLADILIEHWDGVMERYPTWATEVGDHRFDHLVTDDSLEAEEAFRGRMADWRERLLLLEGLSESDALNRDLLVQELTADLTAQSCRMSLWSFSPRSNPLVDGNSVAESHPVETAQDARNLVSRIRGLTEQIGVRIDNLRKGLEQGYVANRASTELVVEQTRDELARPLEESPMLAAAATEGEPDAELTAARAEVTDAAIEWRGALGAWADFLEAEVLPKARTEDVGLTGIPDGAACYAALVEAETSLPLAPDQLHQTGLDEIARLHREMAMLGKRALDRSDIPAIFEYLRTDPNLYFHTEDEVEAKASEALARAKAAIPGYFGRLPKADCEVKRIPDYQAPYTTIAYYMPVVPGEKPGYYYINTYQPETRPRHEAEVLAFHESIPGHHLQIAISTELDELPMFRRHLRATAFVEGWGLYSEQLADEMGLYSGDTDRLGMYSFELWRASRLVVDTGIHAKGWTREQAIDFMVENTPLARNNIENEVDRYITTPGQALAYKTGQLEIWRLRRDAEARLGERFDIKAFHDVVLGAGALPLKVLGQRVEAWVASVEAGG
ncbi:MAG: DUF885 domain-containing protein [Alphaproteobacteria bacterium]|nr:DUF885 domain-containing protein [Alphaproteobacteria bacterium]